ncbi:T9SS type A sorting domain-containing protein [Flavobacterium amnicola]|uniref:T9SS type A sorting domain-containing protein n=1 Tax=Flavobacterium amnicola TaxID=2506422 RepID=A0A4Q1K2N1_9FLAO|nr:T9SS type A sorting domain-containing protein [Flavobacterium amnicola]RXR17878.1 T9SS type A sorting domain-containing protein [Flavobacterium amnicola]
MKKNLLQILLLILANNLMAQSKIGSDINGGAPDDVLGFTVSLSSNGSRVATGAPYNTVSSINGYAHVHEKVSNAWTLRGTAIAGEALSDNFGRVAISGDGTRLISGASTNDGNGVDSGHVRVYNYNGTNWAQMGTDINGEAAGDQFGVKTAISNDGTVIAVGAHLNDGAGVDAGHVRVYSWNGSSWIQRGTDINGSAAGDEFGTAVSLSPDGTKLAVGARKYDGFAQNTGHVKVYNWNGSSWVLMGSEIQITSGALANDNFGSSVAISNTGTRVVIGASLADNGATTNCGQVRVYNYSGSVWSQLGGIIYGTQVDMYLGNAVAINGAGDAIFVGAPGYDASASNTNRGLARYYKWNGTTWNTVGTSIIGNGQNGEQLGYAVALSNDGNTAAVGIPTNPAFGYVQIYDYTAALSANEFSLNNKFNLFPNPANDSFEITSAFEINKVEIYSLQGQLIKAVEGQKTVSVADLPTGIYSLIISSEEGKGTKKLIKN